MCVCLCHSLLLHFQSWRRTVSRKYSRKWTPWTNARSVSSAGRLSATYGTTTTCTFPGNTRAAFARPSIPAAIPCWCTAVPNTRNWTCEDGSETLTHYCSSLREATSYPVTTEHHRPPVTDHSNGQTATDPSRPCLATSLHWSLGSTFNETKLPLCPSYIEFTSFLYITNSATISFFVPILLFSCLFRSFPNYWRFLHSFI